MLHVPWERKVLQYWIKSGLRMTHFNTPQTLLIGEILNIAQRDQNLEDFLSDLK